MDVRDGAKSDWSVVQQWTCKDDAKSMLWYSERNDFAGTVKLKNWNSDLCLDVRGGASDEGAQLQQFHCTSNNAAQEFWQMDLTGIIVTDLDLNGNWTDGSTRLADGSTLSARIYVGLRRIAIDMSAFGRPNASGFIDGSSAITVTFPDDRQYTGQLRPPNTIRWSNGSIWTKMP
jgi:hypothetical protein